MVKTVLDANVLVSAAFGGVPALAVKMAFLGEVWISGDIKKELLAVSPHLPKRLSQEQLLIWNSALLPLITKMQLAQVDHHIQLSRDPKDDMYLSLAKAVSADFLVTGDLDLLSISKEKLKSAGLERLSIGTPRVFLKKSGRRG